jgi:hypothetical protein
MAYTTEITKAGDRWDTIAFRVYGDVKFMPDVIKENPEIPLDIPIPAGTILKILIKEVAETNKELLPPWKK